MVPSTLGHTVNETSHDGRLGSFYWKASSAHEESEHVQQVFTFHMNLTSIQLHNNLQWAHNQTNWCPTVKLLLPTDNRKSLIEPEIRSKVQTAEKQNDSACFLIIMLLITDYWKHLKKHNKCWIKQYALKKPYIPKEST